MAEQKYIGLLGYCNVCGWDRLDAKERGSWRLELALWVLGIFPGMLYRVWRAVTRTYACRTCGASAELLNQDPDEELAELEFSDKDKPRHGKLTALPTARGILIVEPRRYSTVPLPVAWFPFEGSTFELSSAPLSFWTGLIKVAFFSILAGGATKTAPGSIGAALASLAVMIYAFMTAWPPRVRLRVSCGGRVLVAVMDPEKSDKLVARGIRLGWSRSNAIQDTGDLHSAPISKALAEPTTPRQEGASPIKRRVLTSGLWVCTQCSAVNDASSTSCAACATRGNDENA